jgi:hypothetical protein
MFGNKSLHFLPGKQLLRKPTVFSNALLAICFEVINSFSSLKFLIDPELTRHPLGENGDVLLNEE